MCYDVAMSMYARKNPVKRARIYRDYMPPFGPVAGDYIDIEESEEHEFDYHHYC